MDHAVLVVRITDAAAHLAQCPKATVRSKGSMKTWTACSSSPASRRLTMPGEVALDGDLPADVLDIDGGVRSLRLRMDSWTCKPGAPVCPSSVHHDLDGPAGGGGMVVMGIEVLVGGAGGDSSCPSPDSVRRFVPSPPGSWGF